MQHLCNTSSLYEPLWKWGLIVVNLFGRSLTKQMAPVNAAVQPGWQNAYQDITEDTDK